MTGFQSNAQHTCIGEEKANGPQGTNYYPIHKKSIYKKTILTNSAGIFWIIQGLRVYEVPRESRTFNKFSNNLGYFFFKYFVKCTIWQGNIHTLIDSLELFLNNSYLNS